MLNKLFSQIKNNYFINESKYIESISNKISNESKIQAVFIKKEFETKNVNKFYWHELLKNEYNQYSDLYYKIIMYGPNNFNYMPFYLIDKHYENICDFIDFLYENNLHKIPILYNNYGCGNDIIKYSDNTHEPVSVTRRPHCFFSHLRDHIKIGPNNAFFSGKIKNKLILRGVIQGKFTDIFFDESDFIFMKFYNKKEVIMLYNK